jgi:hypothetical protein
MRIGGCAGSKKGPDLNAANRVLKKAKYLNAKIGKGYPSSANLSDGSMGENLDDIRGAFRMYPKS